MSSAEGRGKETKGCCRLELGGKERGEGKAGRGTGRESTPIILSA